MRNNQGYGKKNSKSKGFVIIALACFLCLSAIAFGVSALNKKGNKKEKESENIVDLNTAKKDDGKEDDDKEDENQVAVDGNVVKNSEQETKDSNSGNNTNKNTNLNNIGNNQTESNQGKNDSEVSAGIGEKSDLSETASQNPANEKTDKKVDENTDGENEASSVSAKVSNLSFGEGSTLKWPVNGNVILDYSMDSTIYFSTLDSYKCNPAIVIQSENGTSVCAGTKGVVKEVLSNEEIGNYVVVGLGDGYELTYGQLDNISVNVGQTVEPDTAIGVVAETTRYYKNEGSNVYFKMTKDGNPCDPLDYLE